MQKSWVKFPVLWGKKKKKNRKEKSYSQIREKRVMKSRSLHSDCGLGKQNNLCSIQQPNTKTNYVVHYHRVCFLNVPKGLCVKELVPSLMLLRNGENIKKWNHVGGLPVIRSVPQRGQ